jgi:GTP-binding protein
MPQTKFVLGKALKIGLKPIVAINKIDRSDERHQAVINDVFDLFAALDASEEQLEFPILYGSAKEGWMAEKPDGPKESMAPLFDLILCHVAPPVIEEGPTRMLATTLEANPYLGRLLTGRIRSGTLSLNQQVKVLSREGEVIEQGRISKILGFRGLEREPVETAEAGDIVAIAGLSIASVADTIADPSVETPIPAQPIDPPTLAMSIRINDGPLAGQEGDKVQSRVIRERLLRESERKPQARLRISNTLGLEVVLKSRVACPALTQLKLQPPQMMSNRSSSGAFGMAAADGPRSRRSVVSCGTGRGAAVAVAIPTRPIRAGRGK